MIMIYKIIFPLAVIAALITAIKINDGRGNPSNEVREVEKHDPPALLPTKQMPRNAPDNLIHSDPYSAINLGSKKDQITLCLHAVELERCSNIARQLAITSAIVEGTDENEPSRLATAAYANRLTSDNAHCKVIMKDATSSVRAWRDAALNGNPRAMTHYSSGIAFRTGETLSNIPALSIYKDEAESIANRAAHTGDAIAMFNLAEAHYPWPGNHETTSLLSQSISQKDPRKSLAIYIKLYDSAAHIKLSQSMQKRIERRISKLKKEFHPETRGNLVSEWPTPKLNHSSMHYTKSNSPTEQDCIY